MAFGASPSSLRQGGLATSLSVAEGIAGKLNAAAAKDIIETKARIDLSDRISDGSTKP